MKTEFLGTTTSWLSALVRRHPSAALPAGSALSDPPESLDPDTAKVALEQVNKRLDAELALKSSTETRALTLAGQCTTLLSAVTAGLLIEAYGNHRTPLLAAGIVAAVCLFFAILFAYSSANPRKTGVLPGRLPDELWDDLTAPDMKGPEFIGRLMLGLQDAMVENERNQDSRARSLTRAILMVRAAVPLAVVAALMAPPISLYLGRPLMADTTVVEKPAKPLASDAGRATLSLEPPQSASPSEALPPVRRQQ